jgi:flagellar M-ring protein FliF
MSELAASTDLTPSSARIPVASGAGSGTTLRGAVQSLRSFAAQPAVAKSLPAIGFVVLIALAAMIWMAFSAPPARTLFAGASDEEKAAIVEALQTAGIDNSVNQSTGEVQVSESDYHQARMLLASQGLPRSGPDASEALGNLPLGSSRAVESERIRSAREMDLARTIEGIDVVQSARVHLAVDAPSLFVRDRARPAASVMLTLASGRSLGDSQVQAIVHLVASSVPGLAPDEVSVVDQNGRLLSRTGADAATAASERQIAVQASIEDRYRRAVSALLTPIVGEGNFSAEVHADVDFAEVQSTREGFPQEQRALRSEEGQLSTDGSAGTPTAGGIPGTLSNEAPPASQVAAAPGQTVTPAIPGAPAAGETGAAGAAGGRRTENYARNFAVGREVSVTRQPIGTVKRLSVAIALRNPQGGQRGRQELQALEQLVKGAVGFDQARGDVVALTARNFVATEAPVENWYEAGWVSATARNLTALALAALLIFGLARPLLRKGTAMLSQRAATKTTARSKMGGEIATVLADYARTSDIDMRVSLEMIEATRDYETRAALIRNFVRQDPARAALVVRDLIRADTKHGAAHHG